MRILNMTQHDPTPEQFAAGVVQPVRADHERIKGVITFEELPAPEELSSRARQFAALAQTLMQKYACNAVMIGGAPYFAAEQESALRAAGIRFCYAFSKRDAIEEQQPDGSVLKKMVFKHAGFIWKGVRP
jgi:hypothetical protein